MTWRWPRVMSAGSHRGSVCLWPRWSVWEACRSWPAAARHWSPRHNPKDRTSGVGRAPRKAGPRAGTRRGLPASQPVGAGAGPQSRDGTRARASAGPCEPRRPTQHIRVWASSARGGAGNLGSGAVLHSCYHPRSSPPAVSGDATDQCVSVA